MDVSCPRCKTEYEFDDARVPDAGVTVKCTTCNHVFRVKRVAGATQDVPLGPQEVEFSEATLPAAAQKVSREWKVRTANGNITTFSELSELQRQIVESKVTREDEVSLTGDSWKRLGHIPEFTTFFNLVDQAKKAEGVRPAETVSPILSNIESELGDVPKSVVTKPLDIATPATPVTAAPVPAMQQAGPSLSPPSIIPPPPPPPPSGNRGVALGLALAVVAFGGLAYYYFMMMRPAAEQAQQLKEPAPVDVQPVKKAEVPPAPDANVEEKKPEPPAEEVKAPVKVEPKADEKTAEAPPVAEPEPPKSEKTDTPKPQEERAVTERSATKKREPSDASETGSSEKGWKRGADFWIARGDRLRDKEKPQSALDAYGKALDMSPDNVEALTGKGLSYLDMGKPAHAEPLLEQAMKVNPKYAPALMGIAESYRLQSKKDAAIKAYQRYLDAFPNGPEASVAKANIQRLK